MTDQRVAVHLASHTHVLYVDPPLSPLTALRHPELSPSLRDRRLRRIGDRLMRVTPLAPPGKQRPGVSPLTRRLLRRTIATSVADLGRRVWATIALSPHWDVFGAAGEDLGVYWALDDVRAGAELMGLPPRRVAASEAKLVAGADVLVTSSLVVREHWAGQGRDALLVPNGCDPVPGVRSATVDGLEPPVAGFVGHLSERIDWDILEAMSDAGISLLLVGPRQATFGMSRAEALFDRPNVAWVGPKHPDELPAWLAALDVGLVPYTRSAFNLASFPLKILEYLASGRPVVSSDLPAARWLDSPYVAVAHGPAGFVESVRATLGSRTDMTPARCRAFAAEHTWERRIEDLLGGLDARVSR